MRLKRERLFRQSVIRSLLKPWRTMKNHKIFEQLKDTIVSWHQKSPGAEKSPGSMEFYKKEDRYVCNPSPGAPILEMAYILLTNSRYTKGILFNIQNNEVYGYGKAKIPKLETLYEKIKDSPFFVRSFLTDNPEIEINFAWMGSDLQNELQIIFLREHTPLMEEERCRKLLECLYKDAVDILDLEEKTNEVETISEKGCEGSFQ